MVVEFAITLPIVLLFFFAAFEFCRFAMLNHTVDNAVYEASRRGIVPGATAAQVETTARNILSTLGINSATVTVTPNNIVKTTPEVTVAIVVPFNQNSFAPTRFFTGATVQRSLTMQREGSN